MAEQAFAPVRSDKALDVRDQYVRQIWTIQYGNQTGLIIHRDEIPSGILDICS